ncbi:MAG: helix-turn-helix domain-containing protein [Solobacterium sp.]|nr:helix-turn-helix domain-containing protein [Solobacterium sp.]
MDGIKDTSQEKIVSEKQTYTVKEIASLLNISKRSAYDLVNSNQFASVRVGRTIRVSRMAFDKWLNKNC